MLPDHDADGNLPAGLHWVEWDELEARFGTTERRRALLRGLRRALEDLRDAGCATAYVDGSFVTSKADPADFDACWDPHGVDPALIDPVLLDFANKRAAQKAKYGGELFPASARASATLVFLDFFQTDKDTGGQKGIVALDLRRLA